MLLLLLALAGTAPVEGTLERVVDGNTLVVSVQASGAATSETVRVADLECPSVSTVSGQLARKRAQALFPAGTKVTLTPLKKGFQQDKQKRTVALVTWPDKKGTEAMLKDRLCKRVKPRK
jgi:endonuclease YncB( thermonuclease family)